MHTIKVNMIANQIINIQGWDVNIHELRTIEVNENGAIVGYSLRQKGYYTFSVMKCPDCGNYVADNWIIKHQRSGCVKGIRRAKEPQ